MYIIKWKNKWSGEEGFVKCLNREKEYFENAFDRSLAKKWKKATANAILPTLYRYCADNDYEIVVA